MRAIDAVLSYRWAITRDALRQLCAISLRENDAAPAMAQAQDVIRRRADGPSAVAARTGMPLKGTRTASVRDGVAVLPLTGPVFPRANLMTDMSGATSLSIFSADFTAAIDDPAVKAVVLDIDSPGGVASGPAEAAQIIRAGARKKPVVAYVSGWAASAAYWIASAAGEIVAHESAELGSIGVVVAVPVQEQPDANGDMFHEIVSSNARNKRPDPRTEEGRAEIVRELDGLENLFIADVAKYRNVGTDDVLRDFGQGGMLIAAEAVRVGMADRTGDFESLLAELSSGKGSVSPGRGLNSTKKETTIMNADDVKKTHPAAADALIGEGREAGKKEGFEAGRKEGHAAGLEEGRKAERDRLAGIEAMAKPGHDKIVAEAKSDGKSTGADVAMKIITAEKAMGGEKIAALAAASAAIPAIEPSASSGPAADPANDPNLSPEAKAKAAWDADAGLRKEFGTFAVYQAYVKGTAAQKK